MSKEVNFQISSLDRLESESIFILREVAASFERPLLLYSVGKDSSVLLHLCKKAFSPGKIPFPVMHIDTSYKFPEMYDFREKMVKKYDVELYVHRNEEAIKNGSHPSKIGTQKCCGFLKTGALLGGLSKYGVQAAIGGARRDEEKSRAKERVFSFRDKHGQWDPKNQRPELWDIYNPLINPGESIRAFPLSDWTELDVWMYIQREEIPIVPLYFAKKRKCYDVNGALYPVEYSPFLKNSKFETVDVECRYRSLGCMPCTGAIRSSAKDMDGIVKEMIDIKTSERANRKIDYDQDGSMELKKREGYF